LKIVSKIKARERFSVYIVIPMWPEGNPTAAAMQEILFWQVKFQNISLIWYQLNQLLQLKAQTLKTKKLREKYLGPFLPLVEKEVKDTNERRDTVDQKQSPKNHISVEVAIGRVRVRV
jgi:hypothetical protein